MRNLKLVIISLLLFCQILVADETQKVEVQVLAKTSSSWDNGSLPKYPKGTPEISILKITIPAKTTLELHKHPVINAGYLISGKLKVITEKNEILELKAGDGIVEVVNKWHYGENNGDEPAVIVVVYAGIKDEPITIKK